MVESVGCSWLPWAAGGLFWRLVCTYSPDHVAIALLSSASCPVRLVTDPTAVQSFRCVFWRRVSVRLFFAVYDEYGSCCCVYVLGVAAGLGCAAEAFMRLL